MRIPARDFFANIFHRRWLRWLATAYLVYLALCIVVIMPLLNWGAGAIYQQETGRKLIYDPITINPLALSITATNIKDDLGDGTSQWSAERIHINVSLLQSLSHLAPTLDEVALNGIHLRLQKQAADRWNFSDIEQHRASFPVESVQEPTATNELPRLIIQRIHISARSLSFSDSSHSSPFDFAIDNINFVAQKFSTQADHNQPFHLHATIGEQGTLNWTGNLSLATNQSDGELSINQIHLQPAWEYTKSHVNFTLKNSLLNAQASYVINWDKDFFWSITQGDVTLVDNQLDSSENNTDLALAELRIQGINASSQTQLAEIDDIQLNGLTLASWSQGSDSGLIDTLTPLNTNSSIDEQETDDLLWTLFVKNLALNNASIDWRVAELEQRQFNLRKLTVNATNIDTSGNTPLSIRLSTVLDQHTHLALNGELNLHSLDGNFSSNIQALPIMLAQPLLSPYLNASIATGELDAHAELQLRNAELIQVKTSGELRDLKLQPHVATQELLTWKSLRWDDAQIDLTQQTAALPQVKLSGFDSNLVITKEGKINLQTLFPDTPATPDNANNTQQITASSPNADWQLTMEHFILDNASFRFHDESLTPNFTAAVQNFSGTLTELSSTPDKLAQFTFKGNVDGYAPVTLQGKTNPLQAQPILNAQLDFENLDLGGFSGYSSTYAGWRIDRGLLTANLRYHLQEDRIRGENHIEMDQLKLGEKVKNSSAMDIPLRLALALLTDENGLATLDIGISGKTNEPNFNIGKVIQQALRNTLVKIVKSPFTWLATLVGSKEDLGQLPFNSGSSQLLTTATRKLNALEQALNKRPELRIQLRGHYDQNTDRRGIQAAQIKPRLLEHGLNNNDIKTKSKAWENAVAVEYRKLKGNTDSSLSSDQMYDQLLQTIEVLPETLNQLAAQRSINAKQFLVQQLKIDGRRVLINSNLDCNEPGLCSRRLVSLELSDLNQQTPVFQ